MADFLLLSKIVSRPIFPRVLFRPSPRTRFSDLRRREVVDEGEENMAPDNILRLLLLAASFGLSPATTTSSPPPEAATGFFFPFNASQSLSRQFLDAHNRVRHFVGEAPIIWNHALALYARRWAKRRRIDCKCIHSGGPYGENMFWGTGQGWRAIDAVRSWALEHYDYDRESNSCKEGKMCGHYTQIVWNATVMVGCARQNCVGGGVIVVCSYHPPGNFFGENPFQSIA